MEKLHPGAKWQFRVKGYFLFLVLGLVLGSFVGPLFGSKSSGSSVSILLSVLGYILFAIIASEIYAQMSYNRWLYEFTDNGFKSERGIIWKRYSNIPYERIQNIDITRGIIARMFGFSSVMIQTAGFSGPARAEGNIPAVDIKKAEEIRNFLMGKITRRK
ncbi:hypothetical protein D6829_02005 [Candidatus Pacearchaeota archaeon]|nr:MAG: hypothetical protein D6829_02005 [Candidatus Pacearchaeota archaeon]